MIQTWYQHNGQWIPERPLEPPDCYDEEPAEPYEEEYDKEEVRYDHLRV